jgi:hypothetical protein
MVPAAKFEAGVVGSAPKRESATHAFKHINNSSFLSIPDLIAKFTTNRQGIQRKCCHIGFSNRTVRGKDPDEISIFHLAASKFSVIISNFHYCG